MKFRAVIKKILMGLFLPAGLFFSAGTFSVDGVNPITKIDSIYFSVSYKSKVEPLPLNSIHSWILHVNTLEGKTVEKATIVVDGGMPAHAHGLPTQPEVTELGHGDYLIEGIKFSMTGRWIMRFDVKVNDVADRITFKIKF